MQRQEGQAHVQDPFALLVDTKGRGGGWPIARPLGGHVRELSPRAEDDDGAVPHGAGARVVPPRDAAREE